MIRACSIEVWHVRGLAMCAGIVCAFDMPVEASDEASAVRGIRERFTGATAFRIDHVHRHHGFERELARWASVIFERSRGGE